MMFHFLLIWIQLYGLSQAQYVQNDLYQTIGNTYDSIMLRVFAPTKTYNTDLDHLLKEGCSITMIHPRSDTIILNDYCGRIYIHVGNRIDNFFDVHGPLQKISVKTIVVGCFDDGISQSKNRTLSSGIEVQVTVSTE